ncbi:hypothetical protein BT96DRAFT_960361 [Gymnopus androsaceus JB14]|uniref:Helitron helicase-like domain-containing protein n=1 Tax=Gymnopus androsaceus JB14 TaxID=1447944 RepID=A0A6A4GPB3_9AGAR|nr:hypothetical protein BT96DRAFT_960361 [Gymnopus androsaceus JB14]
MSVDKNLLQDLASCMANGGLFGPTSGYYCTVEQQGHLALHGHAIICVKKRLSPQEIKDRVLDQSSPFQKDLLAYLESVRIGEFLTGSKESVQENIAAAEAAPSYITPECTLPIPPPPTCDDCTKENCPTCLTYSKWFLKYQHTIDNLVFKSNWHECFRGIGKDGTIINKAKFESSCLNNNFKQYKARFPRECFPESVVDPDTGHISLKKGEKWLNDVIPALTYLVHGNTDVTSLMSGTAIKAAVVYIADYITKTGLKTHVVFRLYTCYL